MASTGGLSIGGLSTSMGVSSEPRAATAPPTHFLEYADSLE